MTFEERYSRLNKGQREAVDAIEGPVMVIAGPGTGKTTLLTLRIANILKKTDVPPDAILALTFTESGARAMRAKLADIIGPAAYRVAIHTFHSFANEIIKSYPDKFPRIIGAEHVEGLEQIALVEKIINEGDFDILRPKGDPAHYVTKVISAIKDLKREKISPDILEELLKKEDKSIKAAPDLKHEKGKYAGKIKGEYLERLDNLAKNRELLCAYRMYEKAIEESRLYDFEDMIIEVVKKLEADEDLRLRIQEEHQYILADEHQDANAAQNKLLELISSFHDEPNLFIVGDEKQAIFRFQGASLENFLYFKRKHPNAKLITLTENYRSHQTILDASHSLILNNPAEDESLRKKLVSLSGESPRKISCLSFGERSDELAFISSEAQRLIASGIPASEIAVLVRTNAQAEAIERALSSRAVPAARHADSDALRHVYAESLFTLMRAALHPADDEMTAKALFAPFLDLDIVTVSKSLSAWRKKKGALIDHVASDPELKGFAKSLSRYSKLANGDPLVEAFETIARDSGFLRFILGHKDSRVLIPLYSALLNTVTRFAERERSATLRDFIERLDHAREHGYAISSSFIPPEGVAIMTAHGSKGLEWSYVFIPHAADGSWGGKPVRRPFKLSLPDQNGEDSEDERRLFYVAMTRARKHVYVSYSLRDEGARELSPSRFISEIADHTEEKKMEKAGFALGAPAEARHMFKDKEYLRKLFLERGFSATHLNSYLECPWRYFFVNLLQVPKSQENPQLYGSAVHAALCYHFECWKREEDAPIDSVLAVFESELRRTHMTERDLAAHLKSGREDIAKYLSGRTFPRAIWNEYNISGVPFKVGADEIRLTGKLDKVELLEGGRVRVVDYKTGKPRSRNAIEGKTKDGNGDYKRQLVFYKLLLDRYKDGEWKMESGTIDFIRPGESGKAVSETFAISSEEVKELEALIEKTAGEIMNLSFEGKRCGEKDCEWCALRQSLS